jgi:pentatricopeptide repeat protein
MLPDFGCQQNSQAYDILLKMFVENGVVLLAKAVYNQMIKLSIMPSRSDYNSVLIWLCKFGQVDDAFAKLADFQVAGFVHGLYGYSSLIDGLFRVGRFDEACCCFHKMLNDKQQAGP